MVKIDWFVWVICRCGGACAIKWPTVVYLLGGMDKRFVHASYYFIGIRVRVHVVIESSFACPGLDGRSGHCVI
jgi:hypothetical protein